MKPKTKIQFFIAIPFALVIMNMNNFYPNMLTLFIEQILFSYGAINLATNLWEIYSEEGY